jgi:FlaA1/EpsC-like NDP-sugar epimerase
MIGEEGFSRLLRSDDGGGETCGLAGEPVLVTGAGGYIGSALAKRIAAAKPAGLILLDASEQNLFEIHRRLCATAVPHEAVLGSVTDRGLLDRIFRRHWPRIVFHAAALKHVALLELNPSAAVYHNAMGTYALSRAAMDHGAATVVLVSTDKAVNPHSIMGASKRIAELIVAALGNESCRMNAVRLGNVIGSSGSVLGIFREQIAGGGPVTVTHPEASRYFMTRRDAVEAILAGCAAGSSGRILLPDVGEPRSIADLARFLIGASGREVGIEYIGLRPGEKLREDLVFDAEIREGRAGGWLEVIRTPAPAVAELHKRMADISSLLAAGDVAGLIDTIVAMVPEYQPSGCGAAR